MLTYKLWETYIYENWAYEYNLDFCDISIRIALALLYAVISLFTICVDILAIPIYIIAFIVWYIREC